jgi:hypothetical protein
VQAVPGYVDQVVRKVQFLSSHPDVEISTHPDEPPHRYWRGQVPGLTAVTSHDLGSLLDHLENQVAARDAQARWPNWTFTHTKGGWQAKETHGPELLLGRTIAEVEARVEQWERIEGSNDEP